MRTQSNYYENKVLGDLQTIIRTLRCESGGSGNCCPETNEILVNIKSNLDSVLETCVSETNQSNQLIVRPTSASDPSIPITIKPFYGGALTSVTIQSGNPSATVANSIYLDGSTDAVLTARDGELSDYITVRRSNNAFLNMEIGRTIL